MSSRMVLPILKASTTSGAFALMKAPRKVSAVMMVVLAAADMRKNKKKDRTEKARAARTDIKRVF